MDFGGKSARCRLDITLFCLENMDNTSSTSPFFSVIIPAYNRAGTILPTLNSVREQTFRDFECIVVDDGSSDSKALKKVIEGLGDERFRYVWRENGGGGAARNTGIEAACGQYIAFLDSDDLFLSKKLEVCRAKLSGDPLRALYSRIYVDRGVGGNMWVRPDRGIGPDEDMGAYLFIHNQFITTPTIVLHREAAAATLFDPNLRKGQDLEFCLKLHKHGVRFEMINEPLAIWVDQTGVGRTSHMKGYERVLSWLEQSRGLMTPRAEAGYRATVLFYYMAKHHPVRALIDLWRGWRVGVPLRVIVRQFLRGFLPSAIYRSLVDGFVALKGRGFKD